MQNSTIKIIVGIIAALVVIAAIISIKSYSDSKLAPQQNTASTSIQYGKASTTEAIGNNKNSNRPATATTTSGANSSLDSSSRAIDSSSSNGDFNSKY